MNWLISDLVRMFHYIGYPVMPSEVEMSARDCIESINLTGQVPTVELVMVGTEYLLFASRRYEKLSAQKVVAPNCGVTFH